MHSVLTSTPSPHPLTHSEAHQKRGEREVPANQKATSGIHLCDDYEHRRWCVYASFAPSPNVSPGVSLCSKNTMHEEPFRIIPTHVRSVFFLCFQHFDMLMSLVATSPSLFPLHCISLTLALSSIISLIASCVYDKN